MCLITIDINKPGFMTISLIANLGLQRLASTELLLSDVAILLSNIFLMAL